MDFYKSGSYLAPYTEYPIQIGLNEYVYVQYSVESAADLVIMAENCRATKFGAFYSWPYYNLIQNGYVQVAERLVVCVKVDNYSVEKNPELLTGVSLSDDFLNELRFPPTKWET